MWPFLFDTPPLSIFTYPCVSAWLPDCAHGCGFLLVSASPVCVCVFYSLDWSVGALLFSKLVTYFKASNWHDSTPTALRVTRGFIKACIWNSRKMLSRSREIKNGDAACQRLTKSQTCAEAFKTSWLKDPISQRNRFDELQRTCHYLFASQRNIT